MSYKIICWASEVSSRSNGPGSIPDQVMWQTKWHWGRFSPSVSVSPANFHSTNSSTFVNHLIITHHTVSVLTVPLNNQLKKNKKFWEELIAYFPWYDRGHIGNDRSKNSSIVASVFVTMVRFLLSRCLATVGGYTYRHTDWWEICFN
jgi:hypothetical protein